MESFWMQHYGELPPAEAEAQFLADLMTLVAAGEIVAVPQNGRTHFYPAALADALGLDNRLTAEEVAILEAGRPMFEEEES